MIGNLFLGSTISPQDQNSFIIQDPNTVYSALSYPAYISLDAGLTLSGVKEGSVNLSVLLKNVDGQELSTITEQQQQFPVPEKGTNNRITINGVLNLRKIAIPEPGIYSIAVKINDEEVTSASFEAIQAENE
ncbi:hypothetical protein TMUPMC115_0280 [Tetragenococcus muriaticus PMC-11-5]|uniref:Uncharacterized protein n=1 Tax=Tetragenococcus muriaticus PMC-11-5 TaxID=1302649 RepID=A0A091CAE8_9ENTE|nr:hypothetical protein [Tetragenococcus muriaticus]KFN93537.1 hypothetical protein TMUPMC115_0280 [Tetragenococcus muriaticus PMC-11-5]